MKMNNMINKREKEMVNSKKLFKLKVVART